MQHQRRNILFCKAKGQGHTFGSFPGGFTSALGLRTNDYASLGLGTISATLFVRCFTVFTSPNEFPVGQQTEEGFPRAVGSSGICTGSGERVRMKKRLLYLMHTR